MFESESPQPTKDLEVDGLLEEQLADDGEEGLVLEGEQVAMHIDGEGKENRDEPAQDEEDDDDSAMPVPQVRLGPNGEIVLDEMSLVSWLYVQTYQMNIAHCMLINLTAHRTVT